LAVATDRWRRSPAVLEFPQAILGGNPQETRIACGDASQCPPIVHLDLAGARFEIGLVAKIAGHANANVTLGHYTQAIRGGESAALALEQAYAI
jgi:hypothetical protein